jgi:hypothetical protein
VILAEDGVKSTPVICANVDFFPHIFMFLNPVKMRLKNKRFLSSRLFHSAFHKSAARPAHLNLPAEMKTIS